MTAIHEMQPTRRWSAVPTRNSLARSRAALAQRRSRFPASETQSRALVHHAIPIRKSGGTSKLDCVCAPAPNLSLVCLLRRVAKGHPWG
jgi:hypothetical protein